MNEQVVAERRHSASDIVGVMLYSIVMGLRSRLTPATG